jgi:signal transduction histidine kinase
MISTSEQKIDILVSALGILNSSASLDERLRRVADLISERFGVDNCRVYVVDRDGETILMKAVNSKGYSGEEVSTYRMGSGLVGSCASRREPMVIEDITSSGVEELSLLDEADRYSSFATFPVMDDKAAYGVLYLSNERPVVLTEDDGKLLRALGHLVSTALKEERFHSEAIKGFREFSILYDISTAMMTTIKLDRLLHIILTAVTIGDGLGFNRALLFLVNERSNIIQGMMGVGPDSIEEAWRVWGEYARERRSLLELISFQTKKGKVPPSRLNEIVKTIRLSLDSPCVVARTVREQRSFNITRPDEEHFVSEELSEKLGLSAFASVPLLASGKVVGVVVVDNYFNKKPITDEDIRFLTMFANQAGLAIENSLLYSDVNEAHLELKETHERLLHSEKLAALGEMAANVAHEIRNPLTSLGGFARRLHKKLEGHPERKYAEIMVKEVDRLERLLTDVLILSRKSEAPFESEDINRIVESTILQLAEELRLKRIGVVKGMAESLPRILCDPQQMKQVFINLMTNAIQAMREGGALTVSTYLIPEEKPPCVGIAIADTGGGIPEKTFPNIFNPFFTTKDAGTGLGLSISHSIVTNHHGEIEVINRPGEGATFIVKLPIIHEEK